MVSDNIARNMLSSQGTMAINCPTQLHLVGHFYKIFNVDSYNLHVLLIFYYIINYKFCHSAY